MKTILSIFISSVFILSGCSSSRSQTDEFSIVEKANDIAIVLKTRDLNKISKVCTEQGFASLMDWTDSLKNDKLLTVITDKLASNEFIYSTDNDKIYTIHINEKEMKDGDNVGDIVIIRLNGKAFIDRYWGGTSIH